MTADEPRHPLRDTAPLPTTAAPQHLRSAIPRHTRLAGALLVIACLLAVAGAVLPWLTEVDVELASGLRSAAVAWHVWDAGGWLLFPLFAFPLFHLSRAGLEAIRGVPPKLRRLPSLLLSLASCAGVVIFGLLLVFGVFGVTFNPYWGRCCRADTGIGSGFYVSLAGYALASIASLLLPTTSSV